MTQKIPTPIAIGIIIILSLAVGAIVWWYGEQNQFNVPILKQPSSQQCNQNNDCRLTYVGNGCNGCDLASSLWQCVTAEESYKIEMKWQKKMQDPNGPACALCMPSQSPIEFRCTCDNDHCIKTSACDNDADCPSFRGADYKCINNKCTITNQNDTSNWQTYRNEKYGFEVKYPSDFTKQKLENNTSLLNLKKANSVGDLSFHIYITKNHQIDKFIKNAEEINIGNRLGYRYFYREGAGYSGVALIQLGQDALNLSLDYIGGGKDSDILVHNIFNQILSTFRFIDNEDIVISTNKNEYNQGEIVEIKIINKKSESIYVYASDNILNINKFKEGIWEKISTVCLNNCECFNEKVNCVVFSPLEFFYFKFKSPHTMKWNQSSCVYKSEVCGNETYEEGTLKPGTKGNFRAQFCYWEEKDVNLTERPGYAELDKKKCIEKEFIIK